MKFWRPTRGLTLATNIKVGSKYLIANVGTTDWTAIGASSNIAGVSFIATGVGSGTGTAFLAPRAHV